MKEKQDKKLNRQNTEELKNKTINLSQNSENSL